jgi:hypothetical protein
MINQWEEAVTKFTYLHFRKIYDKEKFDVPEWQTLMKSEFPWRWILCTTVDTMNTRWDKKGALGQFWEKGRFYRIVMDEAHRLRTSALIPGQGQFQKGGKDLGTRTKVGEYDAGQQIARRLHSLKPQRKWMLTATPLVNQMTDLRWVLRFLERPSWVEKELPRDCFRDSNLLDWEEFEDSANEPTLGSAQGAVWSPTMNPYEDAPEESMVQCSLKAWDHFVAPHIVSYQRLCALEARQQGQGNQLESSDLEEKRALQTKIGRRAFVALKRIMLRRSMVSRIPFVKGPRIINIPAMKVRTVGVKFAKDRSADLYRTFVDDYREQQKEIGEILHTNWNNDHMRRHDPHWRFIRLVSLSLLLVIPSMQPQYKGKDLWVGMSEDPSVPYRKRLEHILARFGRRYVGYNKYSPYHDKDIEAMSTKRLASALEWGSPKLGKLRTLLQQTCRNEGSKAIVWVYFPLAQWFVTNVGLPVLIPFISSSECPRQSPIYSSS